MNIRLSKRAEKTYIAIREYIIEDFGENVADTFEDKVTDFLELLKIFPKIGSVEIEEKHTFGFQLTKQTKIFYQIKKDQIIILSFFDVRQSPKKKPR